MKCFVIMPYGNRAQSPETKTELDLLYEELIKPAVESVAVPGESGKFVKCHRADKERRPGEIVMHIIENLVLSEMAIADLTGRNPNVFYELGVRHAVNDNTILLARSEEDIPVDLRGQRYFIYDRDFTGAVRLRSFLIRAVEEIVQAPSKTDNPVRRFLYDREKEKIETQGRPPGYDFVRELLQEVSTLRTDFKTQLDEVRYVLNAVTSGQGSLLGAGDTSSDLSFMEGAWIASPSGSHLYARYINGDLVVPYCYAGNDKLTGCFYNFRRIGINIFARFKWYDSSDISGYALCRVEGLDRLGGGWWYSHDVPKAVSEDITLVKQSLPGMNTWLVKRVHPKAAPKWAEVYFKQSRSPTFLICVFPLADATTQALLLFLT